MLAVCVDSDKGRAAKSRDIADTTFSDAFSALKNNNFY